MSGRQKLFIGGQYEIGAALYGDQVAIEVAATVVDEISRESAEVSLLMLPEFARLLVEHLPRAIEVASEAEAVVEAAEEIVAHAEGSSSDG